MSRRTLFTSLLCVACFAAAPALAQTAAPLKLGAQAGKPAAASAPIGYVKTVTGASAFVVTDGKAVKAEVGTPVGQGSVLRTGAASTLGVTFLDSTMMSFGPDTELKVDEYLYAPADGKLKLGASITRGTLNYVSGVIAKLRPDAVNVNTPTGMIGVRGTQFALKVEPGFK